MTRIAIVGGSGKIARLLMTQALARGDEAIGTVRRSAQAEELRELGGEGQVVDLEQDDAEALAQAFVGADAVVFAAGAGAGSGPARKRTVDYNGSLLAHEAARLAGIRRFVQISAIGVDEPLPEGTDETWEAYVVAKRDADARLRETDLDATILRPGGLTDDEPTGRVTLGEHVERAQIPRADVAAVVLAALDDPNSIGKTWELVSGDLPIADAVAAG